MAANLIREARPAAISVLNETTKALQKIKKVDPRDRYVLLFPDSDSAYVGMAFRLLTCKPAEEVFDQASQLVKIDLLRLCLDGPKRNLLDNMRNRELATFVTSHATISKLALNKPHVIKISKAAGGFGIGFVNSLVFSGSMSFENGLDLVSKVGESIDRAIKIVPNAKVKVRLLPGTSKWQVCKAAIEHCQKLGIPSEIATCDVTKQLYPQVLEIAGHEEAIKYLETEGHSLFKFRFISRVLSSPVATHTNLMRPARDFLRTYIRQKMRDDPDYLKDPDTCSVYPSTRAHRLRKADTIAEALAEMPVASNKSEQLLHLIYDRRNSVAQPNTLVLWSAKLKHHLSKVNSRAHMRSKLFA